jgi:effector-binding domain-containing protein
MAFLPVATAPLLPEPARAANVRVDELPATDVAVLAHHGDYDSMDATYRNLGAWVAEHAEPDELPVRELYIVSAVHTDDPADFRTELCWPIRTTKEPS